MKALFVTAPRAMPCISSRELAVHMASRGHEVWLYGSDADAGDRAATALHTVQPKGMTDWMPWGDEPTSEDIASATIEFAAPLREMAAKVEPNLIVSDGDAVWGALVAEALGLACVTYSAGLFRESPERRAFLADLSTEASPLSWARAPRAPDIAVEAERRINRLRAKMGLSPRVSIGQAAGHRHLVFAFREFEFDGVGLPDNVRCVGPLATLASHTIPAQGDDGQGLILVPEPALAADAAEFVAGSTYRSATQDKHRGEPEVGGCLAAYCSGHFETVQMAIASGLPVLIAPRSPLEHIVARRVEALGLGRSVVGQSPNDVLDAVATDEDLRRNLAEMALRARLMQPRERALHLLEQVSGGTTGEPGRAPLRKRNIPRRPRFARHVGFLREADGAITVGSYNKSYWIAAGAVGDLLARMWETLDGSREIDDVLSGDGDRDEPLALIEWLADRDLLEDATGEATAGSDPQERFRSQIALFAHSSGRAARHPDEGGPRLQARLQNARVGIVGAGVLGSNTARGLALAGVGTLHLADGATVSRQLVEHGAWFDDNEIGQPAAETLASRLKRLRPEISTSMSKVASVPYGELDFLVVTSEGFRRPDIGAIEDGCNSENLPWTSLRRVRWNVEIGPTVIPRMTACYSCFEARRAGALASGQDREDRLTDLDAGGFQWAIGPELACTETVKILTGFGDAPSVGAVLVLSPLQLALSRHPVLRLPNCPRCGRTAEWRNQAMWRDDVSESADVADA